MPRMLPVLFMRRRSLMGTLFAKHSGVSGVGMPLSKSAGHFIGGVSLPLKALIGWTGLENCGNLLNYKLDVSTDAISQFGYRDPNDGVLPFGALDNNMVSETVIYAAHVNTSTNLCQLRFGVNGFSRVQDRDTVTVTWQGYPPLIYLWNGTNLDYEITDIGLTNLLSSLDGQRISFDVEYIAIGASFDGATALRRAVINNVEANEVTISMWVNRTSGVNAQQKMYDIGDGTTPGPETTRFRLNTSAQLKSILSNTTDGGTTWNEVASVTAGGSSVEDVYHHLYMTGKNELVDGVGTQVMHLYEDGVLVGTDTTFIPSNDTTFSFVAGDFITLLSRHDLSQFFTGQAADIVSFNKYIDPAIGIPALRKVSPADVSWSGGVPVELPANGAVNGVIPGNWLGGAKYTIVDYNNGVNNGSAGDFQLVGGPIT